jgi:hypothetical protein
MTTKAKAQSDTGSEEYVPSPAVNRKSVGFHLGIIVAISVWLGLFLVNTREAVGVEVERNFAGSAQLDYLMLATRLEDARDVTFDGFTTELSLKLSVDVGDHVSANVKACYGCHGFEAGMAFVDFRVADEFVVRAGRFTPSFGDFPVRHDPANHLTSDKPLPYDMGRMVRLREWGMSILPAPYVDSGVELRGTFYLGEEENVHIDYRAYIVGGFRGGAQATDIEWVRSRSGDFYYVDNNSTPSGGARLALGALFGDAGSFALGVSGLYGQYDPDARLDYMVLGADAVFSLDKWTLRIEYLLRRTEMSLGDDPASGFRYGPNSSGQYDAFFVKDGFYASTDLRVTSWLELVGRVDGLRRLGNVPMGSDLRSTSAILRYTAGLNFVLPARFRVKLSGEFYDFSDFDDEVAIHAGVVGAF